jgi:biotin carboxyl carrier protein
MRRYELDINGRHFSVAVHDFTSRRAELEIDGTRYTVDVTDIVTEGEGGRPFRPAEATAQPVPTRGPGDAEDAGGGAGAAGGAKGGAGGGAGVVAAPIPGQVLEVLVAEGDEVKAGRPVLKMEAMKMENVINAPIDGTVQGVSVNAGDAVTQGQELLVIG